METVEKIINLFKNSKFNFVIGIGGGSVLDVAASHRGENIAVATDEGLVVYYESQLDNQAPIATINSITPTIALPGSSITMNGSGSDSDGEIVA